MKYFFSIVIVFFVLIPFVVKSMPIKKEEHKIVFIYSYNLQSYLNDKSRLSKINFLQKNFPNTKVESFFLNCDNTTIKPILDKKINKIQEDIDKFNPELIITYGTPAFEYYTIPRQNKNTPIIFFDVPNESFYYLTKKYNISETLFKGITINNDYNRINYIIDNSKLNTVNIIKNSSIDSTSITDTLKQKILYKKINIYEITNTYDLINVLKNINKDEKSIIINTINDLCYSEISNLFNENNFKNLEINLNKNLSEKTFAISTEIHIPIDQVSTIDCLCNKMIYNHLQKIPNEKIQFISPSIFVNKQRLTYLGFNGLVNDSKNYDYIYKKGEVQ